MPGLTGTVLRMQLVNRTQNLLSEKGVKPGQIERSKTLVRVGREEWQRRTRK